MKLSLSFALVFCCLLGATGRADVVVPNANAGVEAPGTFSLTSTAAAGRTFQLNIEAGQLASVVGQDITGLQFRLNNSATAIWPTVDTSFAFWDVFVGPGVDPSAMSNTFAANFTSGPTQVRSGGLTFTAGSFGFGQTGTVPNAFGSAILFNTPYAYTGGDLTIEMRFSGQVGATNQPAFDAITASGGPGNGWGVDFAGRWTSSATGTSGGNANFLVTNLLTQSSIPEPATGALAGLLLAGLLVARRRC